MKEHVYEASGRSSGLIDELEDEASRSGQSGLRLTLFLHGFPGIRSRQNRDLAEALAKQTGRPSHVLLYPGLSQAEGRFSFRECLDGVHARVERLFEEHDRQNRQAECKIDLVGHSWGGFLALTLMNRHPERIRRAVLMSPLLEFAAESLCENAFAGMARENPQISIGDPALLAQEFIGVSRDFPTDSLISGVNEHAGLLILQSREDEITPASVAAAFLPRFRRRPLFELVDTDHSFLVDRERLATRIGDFLQ
jgi:pimeloyl-ACP methyl ester carboxylesterase